MLDRAGVVARPQLRRPGPRGEGEQLGEAEAAVAATARVRRLTTGVRLHERLDDGVAELLAEVERHVRQSERVARLPSGDHGVGGAAGALRIRAGRVEPEPQRDTDRLRPRAEQRDGAVDAAAHCDRDPARVRLGPEDRSERVRERVGGERLPGDGGRLEQRQARQRALEARRVGGDDPVAVDREPHERELLAAGGVSEHLEHATQRSAGPIHCPSSTLCVALRVNVNQQSRQGSPSPD